MLTWRFPLTLLSMASGLVIGNLTSFIWALRREKFTVILISLVPRFFTGTIGEQKSEVLSLMTPASSSLSISFCTGFSRLRGILYGLEKQGVSSVNCMSCCSRGYNLNWKKERPEICLKLHAFQSAALPSTVDQCCNPPVCHRPSASQSKAVCCRLIACPSRVCGDHCCAKRPRRERP